MAPNNEQLGLFEDEDGWSTSYYQLPEGATELQDLIETKNMNFALGNIFKACYRYGSKNSNSKLYDINKIIWFAERLKEELLNGQQTTPRS